MQEMAEAISQTMSAPRRMHPNIWQQNYDPFGNVWLSTIVAALPLLLLFYLLAVKRIAAHIAATAAAITCAVIAVLLISWRHWIPPLLAIGFGLTTLGAFVMSATGGFYGVHELWTGTYVTPAWVSEVVAVLGGAALVLLARPWRSLRGSERRAQVSSRSNG